MSQGWARPQLAIGALALALAVAGCGRAGSSSSDPDASGSGGVKSRQSAPGGEKSIEDFGVEAAGSSRRALVGSFRTYLTALATQRYPVACAHLSRTLQRSLARLLTRPTGRPCQVVLTNLLAPAAAAARGQASGKIARVRVQGGHAFVVFRAPGADLYQLPMVREQGGWKASIATPSILVPSAASLQG